MVRDSFGQTSVVRSSKAWAAAVLFCSDIHQDLWSSGDTTKLWKSFLKFVRGKKKQNSWGYFNGVQNSTLFGKPSLIKWFTVEVCWGKRDIFWFLTQKAHRHVNIFFTTKRQQSSLLRNGLFSNGPCAGFSFLFYRFLQPTFRPTTATTYLPPFSWAHTNILQSTQKPIYTDF